MPTTEETLRRLSGIPHLSAVRDEPLAAHTRFAIGGPADFYAEAATGDAFAAAACAARELALPLAVIGGGTNLIAADEGFRGLVLRFVGARVSSVADRVTVEAGADLQSLVEFAGARGLKGLATLAGIPGSVGAAVYGNAGAYGHSISERVEAVRFWDGGAVDELAHEACEFTYRSSIFKRRKDWLIFSVRLHLEAGAAAELQSESAVILKVRNDKFPATMKCAGSVFKNLLFAELPPAAQAEVPPKAVREGKVPAAWFLEQVGAKGMTRGAIQVAAYHANLIYNNGGGTAADLRALLAELKTRVRTRFGFDLEEEVQHLG
jgi:UDP-N-acetylmuramate dehydrogenase